MLLLCFIIIKKCLHRTSAGIKNAWLSKKNAGVLKQFLMLKVILMKKCKKINVFSVTSKWRYDSKMTLKRT